MRPASVMCWSVPGSWLHGCMPGGTAARMARMAHISARRMSKVARAEAVAGWSTPTSSRGTGAGVAHGGLSAYRGARDAQQRPGPAAHGAAIGVSRLLTKASMCEQLLPLCRNPCGQAGRRNREAPRRKLCPQRRGALPVAPQVCHLGDGTGTSDEQATHASWGGNGASGVARELQRFRSGQDHDAGGASSLLQRRPLHDRGEITLPSIAPIGH